MKLSIIETKPETVALSNRCTSDVRDLFLASLEKSIEAALAQGVRVERRAFFEAVIREGLAVIHGGKQKMHSFQKRELEHYLELYREKGQNEDNMDIVEPEDEAPAPPKLTLPSAAEESDEIPQTL